jgi:Zn-dependent alcohol dehydrogenase
MPDGIIRFSYRGRMVHHYMGCSTFSNNTVMPEIAVAKVHGDAPFDKIYYIGCGSRPASAQSSTPRSRDRTASFLVSVGLVSMSSRV